MDADTNAKAGISGAPLAVCDAADVTPVAVGAVSLAVVAAPDAVAHAASTTTAGAVPFTTCVEPDVVHEISMAPLAEANSPPSTTVISISYDTHKNTLTHSAKLLMGVPVSLGFTICNWLRFQELRSSCGCCVDYFQKK